MKQIPQNALPVLNRIFAPLDNHLAVAAALAGATPGTAWTDDFNHPRAALLRVHHRFYLAGLPGIEPVNADLKRLFAEEIIPKGRAEGKEALALYYADGWEQAIAGEILGEVEPIHGKRQYWEFLSANPSPEPAIPENLRLVAVEPALVADRSLTNLDDLMEEMQSERESVEAFLRSSFGLCLRSGDRIVTWCLSEYNLGARCEVGIATDANYRRQGLAEATGAAFLRLARSRGIERIGWHCWADNTGSWRTAQKIGYQKMQDYGSFEVFYAPGLHHAVRGYMALERGEYAVARGALDRALDAEDAPAWAAFTAARAASRIGDVEAAFRFLRMAEQSGFRSRHRLETSEDFQILYDQPEWQAMLMRLELQPPE